MPAVGRNEDAIRSYIRQREKKDARLDQLNLWCRHHLQVVLKSGPRQRPRTAASSGSSRNASGFAGGYLLNSILLENSKPCSFNASSFGELDCRLEAVWELIGASLVRA